MSLKPCYLLSLALIIILCCSCKKEELGLLEGKVYKTVEWRSSYPIEGSGIYEGSEMTVKFTSKTSCEVTFRSSIGIFTRYFNHYEIEPANDRIGTWNITINANWTHITKVSKCTGKINPDLSTIALNTGVSAVLRKQ